jgi:DNA-packaging protein gp3
MDTSIEAPCRKVGRPRKWEKPEDLIAVLNKYFEETPMEEYTITGLALAMGTSRQLLMDYQNRPEFKEIVNEAKLIIEHSYEISLRKHGRSGDIFALKNFGWKDRQEEDNSGYIIVNMSKEDAATL